MAREEQHDGRDPRKEPQNEEEAAFPEEPVDEAEGSPEDPDSVEEGEVLEEDAGDTPEEPAAEEEYAALAEELEAVRRERDEYLDALRRLKAEFENSRKRQEKDRARLLEMASERLVTNLLPALDNLDRALDSEGDIREGVRATRDQIADVLAREGLQPVASDGEHFDPNVHEAVMGQPSEEHEEGTVLQTFERGYVFNGKPIRPAKVVVAK